MTPAVQPRPPNTSAVLIVRVWHEESTEPSGLRVRLTGRINVGSPIEENDTVDTTGEALAWIASWLERAEPEAS